MESRITRFTEANINRKVKSKVTSRKLSKRGPHETLCIILNGKTVGKVKVPNPHSRLFSENKSKRVAEALSLTFAEYNDLIKCNMTGEKYFQILEEKLQSSP